MRRALILLVFAALGASAGAAPPATRPTTAHPLPFRYVYDSSSAAAAVLANGWNLIDVGSKWSADHLPRGALGLVWVGDYDNNTCSWQMSDSELRAEVAAAANDPNIAGWFFSDEPNPYVCRGAPAQHRARSTLIHSLDPAARTVIVLDSNGFSGRATRDALDQLPLWKGTADYVGLDPYPCYRHSTCDFSWIARTIKAADDAGISYWGVVQAFDDSSWRWPTPSELARMLDQWRNSRETGSMTFAWTWAGATLSSQPALLAILKRFNNGRSPWRCVVPEVRGTTAARARTRIVAAGCAIGRITNRAPGKPETVVAQKPRAGTRSTVPVRIDLLLGRG